MYVLDTNAIIYYLNNDVQVVNIFDEFFDTSAPLFVSTITVTELFSRQGLSVEESSIIDQVLQSLFVIPVDLHIARQAGELRRQYKTKTPDSLIAATALATHSTLVTRNVADFRRIKPLKIWKI